MTASILSDRQKSMTPILFEVLLLLKENFHYRDLNLVREVKLESISKRMQRRQNEDA